MSSPGGGEGDEGNSNKDHQRFKREKPKAELINLPDKAKKFNVYVTEGRLEVTSFRYLKVLKKERIPSGYANLGLKISMLDRMSPSVCTRLDHCSVECSVMSR